MLNELNDILNLGEIPVDVRAIHYHPIESNQTDFLGKEYLSKEKLSKF